MTRLRRNDSIHHHAQITAGGVLHAHRRFNAAGRQSVLLILHRARTNSDVRKQIGEIAIILRIEHFIRTGKIIIPQCRQMQITNGYDTLIHIRLRFRIGLMQHALVSLSSRSRLIGVNSWDNNHLIRNLLIQLAESGHILKHRFLMIRRARTDYKNKLITASIKRRSDLAIALCLDLHHTLRQRKFFLDLFGNRKLSVEIHAHL